MPGPNRKLPELTFKNAKPKDTPYKIYDEGGLQMLVRPSGTKVWLYPYKYAGRRKTLTIGKYGNGAGFFTSGEARRRRD